MSFEDRFYCIEGVLCLECPFKTGCFLQTGFIVYRVSSHRSVLLRQVLLYIGCPLLRVSLEDRFDYILED